MPKLRLSILTTCILYIANDVREGKIKWELMEKKTDDGVDESV